MFPSVTSVESKNKLRSGQFVQNINAAIIYRLKLLQWRKQWIQIQRTFHHQLSIVYVCSPVAWVWTVQSSTEYKEEWRIAVFLISLIWSRITKRTRNFIELLRLENIPWILNFGCFLNLSNSFLNLNNSL